jgi:hypothetical protein
VSGAARLLVLTATFDAKLKTDAHEQPQTGLNESEIRSRVCQYEIKSIQNLVHTSLVYIVRDLLIFEIKIENKPKPMYRYSKEPYLSFDKFEMLKSMQVHTVKTWECNTWRIYLSPIYSSANVTCVILGFSLFLLGSLQFYSIFFVSE